MDGAFEVARVVGYLLLVPGLVVRGMFLFNRCMTWDFVLHLSSAGFYWFLMMPIVSHVNASPSNSFLMLSVSFTVLVLTVMVWAANWTDIVNTIKHNRSKNMWNIHGD